VDLPVPISVLHRPTTIRDTTIWDLELLDLDLTWTWLFLDLIQVCA